MRIWTVHAARPGRAPTLVPEGFAWGALLFGPLWFALSGAVAPAVLLLAAEVALVALLPPGTAGFAVTALAILAGFCARDIVRGWLALLGRPTVEVVAAPSRAAALLRLADRRPDLLA